MKRAPWWLAGLPPLLAAGELSTLTLGALWNLRERLHFVRENVEPALLALDCEASAEARTGWAEFERQEHAVDVALTHTGGLLSREVRDGALSKAHFRQRWQALGFTRNLEGAGTPADDFLDGLLHLSRHAAFVTPTAFGLLNLATRAARVADFLAVMEPGEHDQVFDLGSGSGKLAVTVAASCATGVRGVEFEANYVDESRASAANLGLTNLHFDHADVRDVDLGTGTVFYLYYPFHGPVARAVAQRLGALARQKDIRVYAAGPQLEFGEHFLGEVERGAFTLTARRGEFDEVLCLASNRA